MNGESDQWLASLLQTSDALFPSGTYAHSLGLEGMVQLGIVTDHDSLGLHLTRTVEPVLEHLELPFARLAQEAAERSEIERLVHLASVYGAMKGTAELRSASLRLGGQRLRLLRELFPHPLWDSLTAARAADFFQPHATLVAGLQAAVLHVPERAALIALFYQGVSTTISAGVKLIRLGQSAAQRLLRASLDRSSAVVERSCRISEEDIGCFQPLLDIASARHESAYTRVFIS